MRAYAGPPTKKELLERVIKSPLYRSCWANLPDREAKEELLSILQEVLFSKVKSAPGLFYKFQHSLGPFALISPAGSSHGRYRLTKFGRDFLLASTYFHKIAENPLGVLEDIRDRAVNDKLDWETISEIFHNYSNGQIAFDDLQTLLGELKTKGSNERVVLAEMLSSAKKTYAAFQICKLLEGFEEHMLEESKNDFKMITKAFSKNFTAVAEPLIGKKDRLAIEQAVKEELYNARQPLTITELAFNLMLQRSEIKRALERLMNDETINISCRTVKPPVGKRVSYYSCQEFPEHFHKICGDCHWYEKRRCIFWRRVSNIAERKIPKEMLLRAERFLHKQTVACPKFLRAEAVVLKIPVEQFAEKVPKRFKGFSEEGEELFEHFCLFCFERGEMIPIVDFGNRFEPAIGSIHVSCPNCHSTFKLIQERIVIEGEELNKEE